MARWDSWYVIVRESRPNSITFPMYVQVKDYRCLGRIRVGRICVTALVKFSLQFLSGFYWSHDLPTQLQFGDGRFGALGSDMALVARHLDDVAVPAREW